MLIFLLLIEQEIAFDILWGLSLFALGITCAVRESQLKTEFYYARDTYNNGAFGACSVSTKIIN